MQDRNYVTKEGRALHVHSLGRVLSAFLQRYFAQYVDVGFTSSVEDLLDNISGTIPILNAFMFDDFYELIDNPQGNAAEQPGMKSLLLHAAGQRQWKGVLGDFWAPFQQQVDKVGPVTVREVIDELDALLGPHLFQSSVRGKHL